jgi:hypothetical protein
VRGDEREQQAGDDQHVRDVQPGGEDVPRVLTAEDEEAQVRSDHRDREHDPVGDPQAGSGQQVVGKRVAREALERGQCEQHGADQPVDPPRLAECAGEEDPQRVQADGGHEEQRCPVVDLPDEQPAAHVEADAERGGVRLGHLDAV